jgi:hypothetical protein
MAFSIKFTEDACPGKKLSTLKRSAAEIYDARRQYEQTRGSAQLSGLGLCRSSFILL